MVPRTRPRPALMAAAVAACSALSQKARLQVLESSAPATSTEAAPPKPFRSATICGMPVIG